MNLFIKYGLSFCIILFGFFHFLHFFLNISFLNFLLSCISWVIFLLGLVYFSIRSYKLPLFLFFLSITIIFFTDTPLWYGLQTGIVKLRELIGFLIVIPLISSVLKEEPYIEDIISLFHKSINTSKKFYLAIIGLTQIIGSFLLFGAITMMYQFTDIILQKHNTEFWKKYKSTAILRGFALTTLWVISIPSFVFIVDDLKASLWISMLQGIIINVIAVLLAIFFWGSKKKHETTINLTIQKEMEQLTINASNKHVQKKKTIEFITLFFSLFGLILLAYMILEIKLIVLVPVIAIFWVISFYFYKRRYYKLFNVIINYFKIDILQQTSYQLNVMLMIGLLIFSLDQTNFSNMVIHTFEYIQIKVPFLNPLMLLPFIVILLGFLGMGPLMVMVLISEIVKDLSLSYPPELVVLSITLGSSLSIMLSPFVIEVIILSASNNLSLFKNGIKFNWKYALFLYLLVQAYLQVIIFL